MTGPLRVDVVDPPAYTPPYDHALCAGLAEAGAAVRLVTSPFSYGPVPEARGYEVQERFYRHQAGAPGSTVRRATRLAEHVPGMLRYRRAARSADVVHFQWLSVPRMDRRLLPSGRPVVFTAHNVLRADARGGSRLRAIYESADAVVVHSDAARERLLADGGLHPERVAVIPHGAFTHLTHQPSELPLPPELAAVDKPVVLCFGLIRPYKGVDLLIEAWKDVHDAELWIVGLPHMEMEPLRAAAPPSVRFVPRFVTDPEIPAFFRRADLVALPYREIDQSGVVFTALAFGRPMLLTDVGGFPEIAQAGAAELVPPGDAGALGDALVGLLADRGRREELASASLAAAQGRYGWEGIGRETLALYQRVTTMLD